MAWLASVIQVDNGSEFTSRAMDEWAYENKVKLHFIEPGEPTQNGHIDSLSSRSMANCAMNV